MTAVVASKARKGGRGSGYGLEGVAVPAIHPHLSISVGRSSIVPSKYSMTAMIFIVMLSFYYFSRHVSDSPTHTPGSSSPLRVFTFSPCPYFLLASRHQDL